MSKVSHNTYQQQSIAILKDFRSFFNKHPSNIIKFWDCPSDAKLLLHVLVNKDIKRFNHILISPSKSLWDFDKKEECDNIIKNWQITFQASDLQGNYFLDLLNNDFCNIKPTYIKGGSWIKQFGHSNLLCTRAT